MSFVAVAHGDVSLAAHQIAFTMWFLLSIPPQAFAIAGQTMVGHALGASDPEGARSASRRALAWGLGSGLGLAALLLVLTARVRADVHPRPGRPRPHLVTDRGGGRQPTGGALLYVIDGILIGAGDTRYLAWSMLVALIVFAPLVGFVLVADAGVVALWWALTGWLLARLVAVTLRYRSGVWLRTGPAVSR